MVDVVGTLDQMQNVGKVRLQGAELSARHALDSGLTLGGNYTLIDAENISNPGTRITDIPRHKVVLHASVRPVSSLTLTTLAEHNSRRWASNTVRLGDSTTFNAKAAWIPITSLTLEAGVNNLADRNNETADGFPSAGRMWFANLNYAF